MNGAQDGRDSFPVLSINCHETDTAQLPPFLIAATGTKNPPYGTIWFDTFCQSVYSLDNLRLKFSADNIEKICFSLDTWGDLYYVETYNAGNRIGAYRFVWVWDKADAVYDGMDEDDGTEGVKISAGFGLVRATGKIDPVGFVDFNPNKCDKKAKRLLYRLMALGCDFELSRFDLAIDYPVKRDEVRMMKDRRKYECIISNGMTEYLGQRNNPGRVKVYDKTAESGLDRKLTRVELTCSGKWDVMGILDSLPRVYMYSSPKWLNLRGVTRAFAVAVTALCEIKSEPDEEGVVSLVYQDSIEPWLRMVDKKTRAKIRDALKDDALMLDYNVECIGAVMMYARSWIEEL